MGYSAGLEAGMRELAEKPMDPKFVAECDRIWAEAMNRRERMYAHLRLRMAGERIVAMVDAGNLMVLDAETLAEVRAAVEMLRLTDPPTTAPCGPSA